jgi:uncharacterized protein (DUF58 family)
MTFDLIPRVPDPGPPIVRTPAGRPGRWRPTHAHLRAVALAGGLIILAVLARRPDAVVLAAPFGVLALWSAVRRPSGEPIAEVEMSAPSLLEGQATTVRLTMHGLDPRADQVVAVLPRSRWFELDPVSGARVVPAGRLAVPVDITIRTLRWGRRRFGSGHLVGTSVLGAYRTVALRTDELTVVTLPLPESFAAVDSVPRPAGLVGLHPSRHTGDGTEIAGVRPYQAGDRLRRINWAVSARTGSLHVTSTWTDRDTEVVLLLDTGDDIGVSAGIDGTASSLDIAVRAAAAVAEHYLRNGDRVRLSDTASIVRAVPSGSGRTQLRRILDALVDADPRAATSGGPARPVRHLPTRPESLVVVFSPLLREDVLGRVVTLAHAGCTVVCVDTLPADVVAPGGSAAMALAWRLRLLERVADIDRLGDLGVPTVPWRGAGTLDEVLRRVSRLAAAPRLR